MIWQIASNKGMEVDEDFYNLGKVELTSESCVLHLPCMNKESCKYISHADNCFIYYHGTILEIIFDEDKYIKLNFAFTTVQVDDSYFLEIGCVGFYRDNGDIILHSLDYKDIRVTRDMCKKRKPIRSLILDF